MRFSVYQESKKGGRRVNQDGMHVHQSVWKDGTNLFAGNGYAGLSDFALYYIGGIIKHAKSLNAFTNPGTNSYKRLVPGFEAPINLAYSARNRSASCRIPYVSNPKGRRVEVRFPDPTCNPYLGFAAMLMAGLDGVQNKIHPGEPMDKNLYDLEPEEAAKVPHPCASLEEALENLDRDREYLTRGGVFANDMFARVVLTTAPEIESPALPLSAVRSDGQQSYVWVIADGKLARRNVATGRRDERSQWIEVTSGLTASDVVLATKFDNLKDGLAAKVVGLPGEAKLADRRAPDPAPASN